MKNISTISKRSLPHENPDGKLVDFQAGIFCFEKLPEPVISTTLTCSSCDGNAHYVVLVDSSVSDEKVWICANGLCMTNNRKTSSTSTKTSTVSRRAILWPLFCELNGIGDLDHGVSFEKVEQSEAKIAYMRKFALAPQGIIVMQGSKGTGKTYAAMAICELFTRARESAMFITQRQLMSSWLETFKDVGCTNFIERLKNKELLVIDDFGTSEISDKFMAFFFDLIDHRMKWSSKGTIITTNLDDEKLSDFCGEALTSRLNTGQYFEFKDKDRRKKIKL